MVFEIFRITLSFGQAPPSALGTASYSDHANVFISATLQYRADDFRLSNTSQRQGSTVPFLESETAAFLWETVRTLSLEKLKLPASAELAPLQIKLIQMNLWQIVECI